MPWSGQYIAKTEQSAQSPVYVAMIVRDSIVVNTPVTATATAVVGDSNVTIDPGPYPYKLLLYNREGWETMTGHVLTAGYIYSTITRGENGTQARAFEKGSQMVSPLITFCTQTPSGTPPDMHTGMGFPEGGGQTLDLREGTLRTDDISIEIQDHGETLTKQFAGSTVVGKKVIIFGGYEGMDFGDFVFLHVGRVRRAVIKQTNVYKLDIDDITRKFRGRLFGEVESADLELSANITDSDTTPTLTSYADLFAGTSEQIQKSSDGAGTVALRAAMYYKIENEIMRNEVSTTSSLQVVRGVYNTTAAAHTAPLDIDMFFGLEASPIGVLVGLCVTRPPGEMILDLDHPHSAPYDWDFGGAVDANKGPLGFGIELADFDLGTFQGIWEDWYQDYIGRFTFPKKIRPISWVQKHILKPLNLCFFVNNVGQLSLAILRPPLGTDPVTFTTADIIGVPEIEMDNEEIINDVTVQYDYDYISTDSASSTNVIDATSQATYDVGGDVLLECRWLDSNRNGASLSTRIAKGKMRHHRDPNPVITLQSTFDKVKVQPGETVRLTHADLPDIQLGKRGWDRLMWVSGKRPNWADGTLEFDMIETAYFGRRYATIAPSGQVDYGSASQAQKDAYVFVSDNSTGVIPDDGSAPYQVI